MEVVSGSCKLSEVGNGGSNGPQFLLGARKVICCVSDGNRERENDGHPKSRNQSLSPLRVELTFPEDLLGATQVPYVISFDAHSRPYAVDIRILIHQ